LKVQTLRPGLSTEEAQALGIQEVVAEYRTRLVNIPSRTHNIALTARLLRGRLIRTGEVFSFNRAVGPRTRARGFLPAPVILRDEFVPGDGGGVCQVSSTLFNAALLADLKVLSRTPHSLPVAYLPVGRDATVVYGAIDLRFRNDGPPLLLWAEVRGQQLVVRFYGRRVPGRTVEIVVTDVERLPPAEGSDHPARSGPSGGDREGPAAPSGISGEHVADRSAGWTGRSAGARGPVVLPTRPGDPEGRHAHRTPPVDRRRGHSLRSWGGFRLDPSDRRRL